MHKTSYVVPAQREAQGGGPLQRWWREDEECMRHPATCHRPTVYIEDYRKHRSIGVQKIEILSEIR